MKPQTCLSQCLAYDHGNNAASSDPAVQKRGNGNIVNDGVRIYQYDAFNRLVQVTSVATSAVIATYRYDAFNRRVQKTIADLGGGYGGLTGDIPAGTFNYYYDGQQLVEKRNNATPGDWGQLYFWGRYIDELLFMTIPTATTYRVLSDLLYRSTAMVDTSNNIVEAYDTDAYGNTLIYSGPGTDGLWFTDDDVTTNSPVNSTIFTGRQFDPESQIYYYRARYYSPKIGRFISRDPIGTAGGMNLYAYCRGGGVNRMDPMGLFDASLVNSAAVLAATASNINALSSGTDDSSNQTDTDTYTLPPSPSPSFDTSPLDDSNGPINPFNDDSNGPCPLLNTSNPRPIPPDPNYDPSAPTMPVGPSTPMVPSPYILPGGPSAPMAPDSSPYTPSPDSSSSTTPGAAAIIAQTLRHQAILDEMSGEKEEKVGIAMDLAGLFQPELFPLAESIGLGLDADALVKRFISVPLLNGVANAINPPRSQ